MSFKVDWNSLETDSLRNWTQELLTEALNSGKRPNILASDITIKDLNFGKVAPNFEILEIGELDKDRFRGIFKINYDGDFHLTLHTQVQANPLNIYTSNSLEKEVNAFEDCKSFVTPNFVLSNEPFALPLDLKLSDLKISGIGIIVFSSTKGLTLVFRNDPLDSIKVSSTFDTVQVLANFLQNQIESQIRDLFRETLPTLIHQLSLKYTLFDNSDLSDFHSQLRSKISNYSDGEKSEKVTIMDLTSENAYSTNNLQKISNLFNSRETLNLKIPKFKDTVQRSCLEKFNKNLPNLINTLKNSLDLSGINVNGISGIHHSNGIPIELLTCQNHYDEQALNNILKEISAIQSNSYYNKLNNTNGVKPKRRVLKLRGKKSKSRSSEPCAAPSDSFVKTENEFTHQRDKSETSTLVDTSMDHSYTQSFEKSFEHSSIPRTYSTSVLSEIRQPQPLRAMHEIKTRFNEDISLPHSHSHFPYNHSSNCYSPSYNPNSSLLSGLGLGNNYFNFTNQPPRTSPIKETPQTDEYTPSKSNNYIDIKSINKNLHGLKQLERDEKKNGYHFSNNFDFPPPPPYHV
ncbi:Piso0_001810 [Millerozyma farinosa CBS 7064]|uniref:Mitochondrial distribution and morphology protein 34 n=1 Tax=Pichia sorbitophila (strain ATCC MYA-4447 / BCRC 22081 / CBS 7064 / NBRC 10061 / NRRL Y-12695) TaxID=559304 RepID=G8YP57_PICSO|nr:Piso0_001810 [Millerozyma farinosa CBS 7064]